MLRRPEVGKHLDQSLLNKVINENNAIWNHYASVKKQMKCMGLGATATIDLEEPNSNTKGKRQGSTSSGTHSHERERLEKRKK